MKKLYRLLVIVTAASASAACVQDVCESEISSLELFNSVETKADDFKTADYLVTQEDIAAYIEFKELLNEGKGVENKLIEQHPINNQAGKLVYYVLNYENGWELIAPDKRHSPVIAYSDSGRFDINNNPARAYWVNKIAEGLAADTTFSKEEEGLDCWGSIIPEVYNKKIAEKSGVKGPPSSGGLYRLTRVEEVSQRIDSISQIVNTHWHQNAPFNNQCPILYGSTSHAAACCDVIATAQVLNYLHHKWNAPNICAKNTVHSYPAPISGYYGTVFPNQDISWTDIYNEDNNALAGLCAYLGYMLPAYYEYSSYAYPEDIPDVLLALGIDSSMMYDSDPSFDSTIISNLLSGMPVIVSGYPIDTNLGHTFLLNGYKKISTRLAYYYEWIPDTPDGPLRPTIIEYSIDATISEYLNMNWGYGAEYDYEWYNLDGSWSENGLDFNSNTSIIYGFSIDN